MKRIFSFIVILMVVSLSVVLAGELTDKVDQLFTEWDRPDSPGCALAIVKNGKIIYKKGYGMANLELDVPITPKTCFYIGSVSKQFVAFSVALLESRGKLSFDDNIRKFFPEMPDYGTPITVRHLIHHTSGIRDYLELADLAGLDLNYFHKGEEVIRLLARQKELNFKPGERHLYSNSGYLMLAEIVRRVSGRSFRQFADDWIFKPLGMKHSRFHDNFTEILKNRATGYFPDIKGGYINFLSTFDLVGSGGLYTTVEDLYLWDQNFYHHKVGGEELIKKVHSRGVLNNNEKIYYAFGIGHGEYKGLNIVGHGGALGGYRAFFVRFPQQKFSVICLSNFSAFNPEQLCYKIVDIYLKDQLKAPEKVKEKIKFRPIKVAEKHLQNKVGAYRNPENGDILKIRVHSGKLLYQVDDFNMVLAPMGKNRFKVIKPEINSTVEFKRKDRQQRFTVYTKHEGRDAIVYNPIKLVTPKKELLEEYLGDFYSEELDATYRVLLKEAKLMIKVLKKYKDEPGLPLMPTLKDEFKGSRILIKFLRNEEGKITGATLDSGRVKNLKFKKTR